MKKILAFLFFVSFLFTQNATGADTMDAPQKIRMYIGTYTQGSSEGIYQTTFDPETGSLSLAKLAAKMHNPSFLVKHPKLPVLYAVGRPADGAVNAGETNTIAFNIDAKTGDLTPFSRGSSLGKGPCHLTVDPAGQVLLVANYSSGSTAIFPLDKEGKLGKATVYQHEGNGPNKGRQEGPHAHGVYLSADARFALVPDLGIDKVMVYDLDADNAKLLTPNKPFAETAPGAGPRHLAFAKDGKFVYVINELDSTVGVYTYRAEDAEMRLQQTISTLPKEYKGPNKTAEIFLHPNGKFLYASNRGHKSIAVYAVDTTSGKLTLVEYAPIGGVWPRYFTLDPSGKFLLVCNRHTDDIVVLRVNAKSGKLTPAGRSISVGQPVCLVW